MSDFDKIFAERLREEAEFPHKEKNWKALGKRLDVFYSAAGGVISQLIYWKAAAAALAIASATLVWKLRSIHEENRSLRKEIAAIQTEIQKDRPAAEVPPVLQAEERAPLSSSGQAADASFRQPGWNPDAVAGNSLHRQPGREGEKVNLFSTKQTYNASKLTADTDKNTRSSTAETPKAELPARDAFSNAENNAPGVTQAASTTESAVLSACDLLPGAGLPPLKSRSARAVDLPAAPVAPPPIAPSGRVTDRFRAGGQVLAVAPQPGNQGISWMKGGGVQVEYAAFRNLWLTAAANWLDATVDVQDSLPRHFLPPSPNKFPKPDHVLVQVEGHPRFQHVSLGLRYALPFRFLVQPSVRVAHTWVHRAPSVYSFKYVDFDHGPPPQKPIKTEYLAAFSNARWTSGLWQFGAALEYTTAHWAFRVGADYLEGGSASAPSFDAVVIQTGALYRF